MVPYTFETLFLKKKKKEKPLNLLVNLSLSAETLASTLDAAELPQSSLLVTNLHRSWKHAFSLSLVSTQLLLATIFCANRMVIQRKLLLSFLFRDFSIFGGYCLPLFLSFLPCPCPLPFSTLPSCRQTYGPCFLGFLWISLVCFTEQ